MTTRVCAGEGGSIAPSLLMHAILHEPHKRMDTMALLFLVCFARHHAPYIAMMLLKR